MLDNLKDLVRNTAGLGVETVKLTGLNGEVSIEGVDADKSIVVLPLGGYCVGNFLPGLFFKDAGIIEHHREPCCEFSASTGYGNNANFHGALVPFL